MIDQWSSVSLWHGRTGSQLGIDIDSHFRETGGQGILNALPESAITQDFYEVQTLYFKGMRVVVKFSTCTLLASALTWWNSHVMTVTHDVAYSMTWVDLRKKMIDKYCPRNEMKKLEAELWNLKVIDKIERYVGGLPDMIHGNIVASKPKTMQVAIEMATELMDKRVNTIAKRQAENKRKWEGKSSNEGCMWMENARANQTTSLLESHYGLYAFQVMPFGFGHNAPAVFHGPYEWVMKPYWINCNVFITIISDIFEEKKEQRTPLKQILELLKKEELYAKFSK
ncbi:reverse transcriptase domain-containing protein [Tanacetum coccineum]